MTYQPYSPEERECIRKLVETVLDLGDYDPLHLHAAATYTAKRWLATCDGLEAENATLRTRNKLWQDEEDYLRMRMEERGHIMRKDVKEPPDYDSLAAEKIMVWHRGFLMASLHLWFDSDGQRVAAVSWWHPTTEPAQAEMVRKAMESDGYIFDIKTFDGLARVSVRRYANPQPISEATILDECALSRAIVEVSLRAEGHIE
ncbi:MAG TPA: hypothetical protein VMW24_24925 [Sedimentisphaerales bacterium]|nr:hypothetical protein [Sedimentisphaerales bacterium]